MEWNGLFFARMKLVQLDGGHSKLIQYQLMNIPSWIWREFIRNDSSFSSETTRNLRVLLHKRHGTFDFSQVFQYLSLSPLWVAPAFANHPETLDFDVVLWRPGSELFQLFQVIGAMFQHKGHVSNIQSLLTNGIIKATLTGKQVGVHEHTNDSHNITELQQTTATENPDRTKQMVTTATTSSLQLL